MDKRSLEDKSDSVSFVNSSRSSKDLFIFSPVLTSFVLLASDSDISFGWLSEQATLDSFVGLNSYENIS